MSFMDFMFGKKSETKNKPIYNPEQEGILDQMRAGLSGNMAGGLDYLKNILSGDQSSIDAFQAPARRKFKQETLPEIAEQFTGKLGEGSQQSSSFGQSLGTASRELEEGLSSQRVGMQSKALDQLMKHFLPSSLLPTQYEYTTDRQPGFLEENSEKFMDIAVKLLPLLMAL